MSIDPLLAKRRAASLKLQARSVNSEELPLLQNNTKYFPLISTYNDIRATNPTAAWYFRHLKIMIIALAGLSIFRIPFFFAFMDGGMRNGIWNYSTIANLPEDASLPGYLTYVTLAFAIVLPIYLFFELRYEEKFIDSFSGSSDESDYTIMAYIPRAIKETIQLRTHFEVFGELASVAIHFSPILHKKIEELNELNENIEATKNKSDIHKRDKLIAEIEKLKGEPASSSCIAFITFKRHESMVHCLSIINRSLYDIFGRLLSSSSGSSEFSFHTCRITQASRSDDIMYDNLQIKKVYSFLRGLLVILTLPIVLSLVMLIMLGLALLQIKLGTQGHFIYFIFVEFIALILSFMNLCIRWLINACASFMRLNHYTYFYVGKFVWMTGVQTSNVLILYFYAYNTGLKSIGIDFLTISWYHITCKSIIVTVASSILVSSGNTLFNPFFNFLQKYRIKHAVTQRQLNKAYEPAEFDIAQSFSISIAAVYATITFCAMVPVLMPLCCVCLLVKYWIDKYAILRSRKSLKKIETYAISFFAREYMIYAIYLHVLLFYVTSIVMVSYGNHINILAVCFALFPTFLLGRYLYYIIIFFKNRIPKVKPEIQTPYGATPMHSYIAPNVYFDDVDNKDVFDHEILDNGDRRCAYSIYWINKN